MDYKKGFESDIVDVSCIYLPKELLAYHLYLLDLAKKEKKKKMVNTQEAIISNIIQKEELMEVCKCLKK